MRNYDLTFVVPADVPEEEFNGVVTQIQSWVEETQGKVTKVDQWGRRRLAYSIGDAHEGHYVSLTLEINPQATSEIERNLKLSSKVIRYLLIRADE